MRRFVPLLALFLGAFSVAAAAAQAPPAGRLDAFIEAPAARPYVGEPLRLVLRSFVRGRVAADRIEQPALTDFDWQQFGVDSSSEAMIDGFWTPVVERVIMLYPLRAGTLTIPPFRRRVFYLVGDNERAEAEFASAPLTIETRPRDGVADAGDFWLPAKSLRISDRWEPEPDKIPFGETATRVVTVEADEVTAERLPPLPNFRAPGVITFAGPVERRTIVTDHGPIGRAVYRWSVRPVSGVAAIAPAIRLRWFDTAARRMREAVAPERRIAFLVAAPVAAPAPTVVRLIAPRPLLAALCGYVLAASSLILASERAPFAAARAFAQRRRRLSALRRAARRGDAFAFRRALAELSGAEPDLWRCVAARADMARALAELDAALYGRTPPAAPQLPALAQQLARALREERRRDD
jgi:hypothetical protein